MCIITISLDLESGLGSEREKDSRLRDWRGSRREKEERMKRKEWRGERAKENGYLLPLPFPLRHVQWTAAAAESRS